MLSGTEELCICGVMFCTLLADPLLYVKQLNFLQPWLITSEVCLSVCLRMLTCNDLPHLKYPHEYMQTRNKNHQTIFMTVYFTAIKFISFQKKK